MLVSVVFQVRDVKPRKVKELIQGHPAGTWELASRPVSRGPRSRQEGKQERMRRSRLESERSRMEAARAS